ncbi:hypothetical protein B0H14DRAFT_3134523 [Mycena olivaceomarginata]|nr:hypothetical protein B0H14DRAFT_3134523 [Mycena olivaceomarginata]
MQFRYQPYHFSEQRRNQSSITQQTRHGANRIYASGLIRDAPDYCTSSNPDDDEQTRVPGQECQHISRQAPSWDVRRPLQPPRPGHPGRLRAGAQVPNRLAGPAYLDPSAATPTFEGLVALLNDARLAVGRPTLGFLNPLLYKRGENAFNEVVDGANPGCGTPGFNATKGWDPVTGLGTPNFKKLMKVCV